MKFTVLTLFPEFVENALNTSILGKAAQKGLLSFDVVNIRDFSADKNKRVDDYTYGGGAGMLMQAQPVYDAYLSCIFGGDSSPKPRTIYVSPKGKPFTQTDAVSFSSEEEIVFICGHYEGIDERALEKIGAEYYSIGDYVLTGGELPALVMIDTIARLCPGVLGNNESSEIESFHKDLLEYPQYTRPETWEGMKVPEVLLTGNPKDVNAWRLEKSVEITKSIRPDLYKKYEKRCEILDKLLKDKRNNIQMIEQLRRGTGEIISEKPLLIADHRAKVAFLEYDAVLSPDELKALLPDSMRSVVVGEKCLESVEGDSGFEPSCRIVNCVYTEKTHRRVINKDIRPLDMNACDYVCSHYELGGPEYAKERIEAGAMYGIYDNGELAGFIGMHDEGSIGMLFIDEKHRGKGYAQDLESFMFNRALERGETPYGQVFTDNTASLSLQDKVGVYAGDKLFCWIHIL